MITCKNLYENKNIEIVEAKGGIKVLEYKKDLSVDTTNAMASYFASKMNVRKRQVLIELNGNAYTISAGAMQWTSGAVTMGADVKGFGDLLGKALSSKVTKESAIKPKYQGNGLLMLEPTYKHILLEDVSQWGGMVLDDGLFLACESTVQQKVVARSNLSSALLGNEGLFNLCLSGQGVAVLESPVPRDELIEFELENDEVRIDGNFAIAWSKSLDFRVEKSGKSLLGSAVSGEGLVNVYRGTGKMLMAPIA
ncbi:transcriptional regulator [Clostridium gelidum]|uniref:Transcriptional regulator n=1 Tax=Clostridium gelidum TaxID=704125 RepID=A0ABM7T983_9CLOT|nr:AIM24 family protein [Clostridium gelidum]BCZ45518.1 transcriptional regulator [Clostridium gelidum]